MSYYEAEGQGKARTEKWKAMDKIGEKLTSISLLHMETLKEQNDVSENVIVLECEVIIYLVRTIGRIGKNRFMPFQANKVIELHFEVPKQASLYREKLVPKLQQLKKVRSIAIHQQHNSTRPSIPLIPDTTTEILIMHLIRRSVFRAVASPALSARNLSTRITASPFRAQASHPSKLISITFRRFNSDETSTTGEEAATESAESSQETTKSEWAYPAPTKQTRPVLKPTNSIYIGNLQFEVMEQDLRREFEEFGPLKNVLVAVDPRGLSKGFGYVEFETVEQATAAIEAKNQVILEGRRMIVNYQGSSRRSSEPKNPPSKTLFIGNLAFEMSDADLNKLFRDIRNVIDVRVAIDRRTGQPRGFAHADFTDEESAAKALTFLQAKEVYGRALRVDYSENRQPRLHATDKSSSSGESSF